MQTKPKISPGTLDMSFHEYLSHPAYGSSDLLAFRAGPPAIVPWRRNNRSDQTKATKLGSAAHCAILTPDLFGRTYVAKPEGMSFASKDGKAWRDEHLALGYLEENILSFSEALQVEQILRAFHGKRFVSDTLDLSRTERTIIWTDIHGLPRKSRPDWFCDDAVYDLKVVADAEKGMSVIAYKAFKSGWMAQLANGREALRSAGHDVKRGRLVVISPKPPQSIYMWTLEVGENDLDILELELANTSRDMMPCHLSGVWPDNGTEWTKLTLPSDNLLADLEGEPEDVE